MEGSGMMKGEDMQGKGQMMGDRAGMMKQMSERMGRGINRHRRDYRNR